MRTLIRHLLGLNETQMEYRGWRECLASGLDQPEVAETLAKSVGYCIGSAVVGDFAEFGTASGKTAAVIAESIQFFQQRYQYSDPSHNIPTRRLHLFDSFSGLPPGSQAGDSDSPHVLSKVWGQGSCKGLSSDELRGVCSKYLDDSVIDLYDGWFEQTVGSIPRETKFALLHIDCDLYESTRTVLDHLLSNGMCSDGAILLFDDFNCNRASPKFGERKAWEEAVEKYNLKYSDLGTYGIKSHRFILHGATHEI